MTTTAPSRVGLDERDERIVLAVVEAWGRGRCPSLREIGKGMGYEYSAVHARIHGRWSSLVPTSRPGLIERGWLIQESGHYLNRTLRPGPLFGGILRNRVTGEARVLRQIE